MSDLKLLIAHTLVEALREQIPDLQEIDDGTGSCWLSGGVSPKTAGTVLNIRDLADPVVAEVRAEFCRALRKRANWLQSEYLKGGNRAHLQPRDEECRALADMIERGLLP